MSSPDDFDDGPDNAGSNADAGDAASGAVDATTDGAPGAAGEGGEQRRRRRRRRRGAGGAAGAGPETGGLGSGTDAARAESQARPPRQQQQERGRDDRGAQDPAPRGSDEPSNSADDQAHRDPSSQGEQSPSSQREQQQQRSRDGQQASRDGQQRSRDGQQRSRDGQQRSRDGQQRGAGDNRGARPTDGRGGARGGDGQGARGGDNQGARGGDNQGARGGDNQGARGGDNQGARSGDTRGRGGENRGGRGGESRRTRGGDNRGARGGASEARDQVGGEGDLRDDDTDDNVLRGDPYRAGGVDGAASDDAARSTPVPVEARHDDEETHPAPSVAWGTEDDSAAPAIALAPDLPVDAPADDPDPLTFPLVNGPGAQLGEDVASVVGVRFVTAGRMQWCDAGDGDFAVGDRVIVDSERGPRLATIATAPARKATRDRGLRRVIRRANDGDLRAERDGDADRQGFLRVAKDKAAALRLPLKVFRVEKSGPKLNVYYTSDERLDLRDFVRDVGQATGLRLELRQLGVRDEAKAVGGIGSCGLTLCCTTWLPDFVPVSIKMAKDQGLVLNPSKVSGQCGRLKCCLVYEQAGYAEMRKGLPKLGKRVITQRGDGRVVEVDVLRQRVRVSYGAGDTEVLPAADVKPMFPPGNQPGKANAESHPEHDADDHDEPDLPQS